MTIAPHPTPLDDRVSIPDQRHLAVERRLLNEPLY
jgi:hypothetical protein